METITLFILPALLLIVIVACCIAMFKIAGQIPPAYKTVAYQIAVIGFFIGALLAWLGVMLLNSIFTFGYVMPLPQALVAIGTLIALLLWVRSIINSAAEEIAYELMKESER